MIKVGIVGGAGYTAGELIRLIMLHPDAELVSVVSRSHSGETISKVHKDLSGWLEMSYDEDLQHNPDVVFLCSGHGKSKEVLRSYAIPESSKIIDLSADFRLKRMEMTLFMDCLS